MNISEAIAKARSQRLFRKEEKLLLLDIAEAAYWLNNGPKTPDLHLALLAFAKAMEES